MRANVSRSDRGMLSVLLALLLLAFAAVSRIYALLALCGGSL